MQKSIETTIAIANEMTKRHDRTITDMVIGTSDVKVDFATIINKLQAQGFRNTKGEVVEYTEDQLVHASNFLGKEFLFGYSDAQKMSDATRRRLNSVEEYTSKEFANSNDFNSIEAMSFQAWYAGFETFSK